MKRLLIAAVLSASGVLFLQAPPPTDWIDPATGHRVVRLTTDAGGSSLYFHDNAFSPEGDKMMVNTPDGKAIDAEGKYWATPTRVHGTNDPEVHLPGVPTGTRAERRGRRAQDRSQGLK